MSQFLKAAKKVLEIEGRALSAKELTEKSLQKGFLTTSGKTPSQTMKSKLSTDILEKREDSQFMRIDKGTFGLREWKDKKEIKEYFAERYEKGLLEEDVIVFPMGSIKKYISKQGLYTSPILNDKEFFDECRSMPRLEAENDFSVIQLISVFIVHYSHMYLTYKRAKRLPEKRLHGVYSMFFGGHLNPEDLIGRLPVSIFEPTVNTSLFLADRELSEELIIPENETPQVTYKGLLYDTSRQVSMQHLGVVYDVFLQSNKFEIGERGFLMDAKFETLEEIELRIHEFENWSVVIFNHEKEQRAQR
ncbi:MAG: HTH domain-containing protein [Thermoleophilia bacterium]